MSAVVPVKQLHLSGHQIYTLNKHTHAYLPSPIPLRVSAPAPPPPHPLAAGVYCRSRNWSGLPCASWDSFIAQERYPASYGSNAVRRMQWSL
jgi:hypothetical protein